MKRRRSNLYIENPFIKQKNQIWEVNNPVSLTRSVSPPATTFRRKSIQEKSITAQVEAGERDIIDHLAFFSSKLLSFHRPDGIGKHRLNYQLWLELYKKNESNIKGNHFVIHQHDHPVAGTHYDLRLQCNSTSSVSWAVMYGLPGDPNSQRLNRNATETRIHCLWNHLIETASHHTGTLLIWDTGVYEILPYRDTPSQSKDVTTDEDHSDIENDPGYRPSGWQHLSEPERLHRSFQDRRIRLRLHGTRLPQNYTLSLWLRRANDRTEQPAAPKRRRKKGDPTTSSLNSLPRSSSKGYVFDSDQAQNHDTDSESATKTTAQLQRNVSSLSRHESPPPNSRTKSKTTTSVRTTGSKHIASAHSDDENTKDEQEQIRKNNAYTGAKNSIHSIHQRRWYLALDRINSGFVKTASGKWVPRSTIPAGDAASAVAVREVGVTARSTYPSSGQKGVGFAPFHVLGRDYERSVITGRMASDILAHEGVVGYVPRGRWRAVTE